jgi:hypothetical protein
VEKVLTTIEAELSAGRWQTALRLLKKLLEGFAECGGKLIEREGGDPPWHSLVSEPAMYRAGVDAARPAYLGKA